MKLKICKLKPKSSLHIGEREDFLESTEIYIHSDTIFSGICHCYSLLYGQDDLKELLQKFIDSNPPFLISSAFPYSDEKFYFPVPENQIPKEKTFKKKIFVEKSGFEKLISGSRVEEVDESLFIPNNLSVAPYVVTYTPRVSLSRLTAHPGENFFYFGEVVYRENAGLFFIYDVKDHNLQNRFLATIRLLADEGLGGDRTSGKGLFYQPEFTELEMNIPDTEEAFVILSLFSPKNDELADIDESFYQLIYRRGYIYSPFCQSLRKKTVLMFKEGSVFLLRKTGKIVDVTPEIFKHHRVYRYGYAFGLPCRNIK